MLDTPVMQADLFPELMGGVVRRAHLVHRGYSSRDIARLAERGLLRRLRHGWYAGTNPDPDTVAVVRSGGVMTCVSALARWGVWVPDSYLNTELRIHARRTEYRDGKLLPLEWPVTICGGVERDARACPQAVDSLDDALLTAAKCQSLQTLVVLIESLLNLKLRTRRQLLLLLKEWNAKGVEALQISGDNSQSGTESVIRLALRRWRIQFRQQVQIGIFRVDFLIGRRLILEIDSRLFHDSHDAYERDRARDRLLAAMGYHVIRLTYHQVMHELDPVMRDILTILRRGEHLRPAAG